MSKPLYQLDLVNPKHKNVYTVLGISEERADEIAEIVQREYKSHSDFSETLNDIFAHMNNFNEVVFSALATGRLHSRGDEKELLEKLESLKQVMELMKLSQEMKK